MDCRRFPENLLGGLKESFCFLYIMGYFKAAGLLLLAGMIVVKSICLAMAFGVEFYASIT